MIDKIGGCCKKLINVDNYPEIRRSFYLQFALLVILNFYLFTFFRRWFYYVPQRNFPEIYTGFSFIYRALFQPLFLLPFLAVVFTLALIFTEVSWDQFEYARKIKLFVLLSTFFWAWRASLYGYNFYFDQPHVLERFIVVLLWTLIYFHPAFVGLFFVVFYLTMAQMSAPLGDYSFTDHYMLIAVPLLFVSYLYVKAMCEAKIKVFLVALGSLIGSSYFGPFWMKLSISDSLLEWPLSDRLYYHTAGYVYKGWLEYVGSGVQQTLIDFVYEFNDLLLVSAFLVESLGMVVLFNFWLFLVSVASFISLHLGIFLSSGTFFWKWIIVLVITSGLIISLDVDYRESLFTWKTFSAFLIVVLLTPMFDPFHVQMLGWWDHPYMRKFKIVVQPEGTTDRVMINKESIKPYQHILSFNKFNYLVDRKFSVPPDLTASEFKHLYYHELSNKNDFTDYIANQGQNSYSPERSRTMKGFLTEYFCDFNRSKIDFSPQFPPHIWQHLYQRDATWLHQVDGSIETVDVVLKEGFFDGESKRLQTFNTETVLHVNLKREC